MVNPLAEAEEQIASLLETEAMFCRSRIAEKEIVLESLKAKSARP